MKKIECENCGSADFKRIDDGLVCNYCHTSYIEDNEDKQTEIIGAPLKISKKFILFSGLSIFFVFLFVLLIFSSFKASNKDEKSVKKNPDAALSQQKYAYKYISDAGAWTQKIYDNLKVAKSTINEKTWEEEDYHDGDSYSMLVQEVGKPEAEFSSDSKMTAVWTQNSTSHHVIYVTINWDKKSGLITQKSLQGWAGDE
jgi:hypothetical protein